MSIETQFLAKWEEVRTSPSTIVDNLAKLAEGIKETEDFINDLKERNILKRLTNNNIRDLAEAMLKQQDTISAFLIIVQGIIFLSMNNTFVLGTVMEAIEDNEKTNTLRDNKYFKFAKEYITEAIGTARETKDNKKEIENLRSELEEISKEIYEQNELYNRQNAIIIDLQSKLNEISKEFGITNELYNQQNAVIKDLKSQLSLQDEMSRRQTELITELHDGLNCSEELHKRRHKGVLAACIIGGTALLTSLLALVFTITSFS